MNEEMLRGLTSRRSNRAFAPEQITDEELHKVLAAGMNAPTAKNGQSPIIIAVQNPDEVAAVNALNAKFTPNANPYYGAPTILLVLVPRTFPLGDLDGAAVLTNLCNGAYAAGLASCWINRPQFMFETNEGREMLRRWGVEGDWRGVGSVAVGLAAAALAGNIIGLRMEYFSGFCGCCFGFALFIVEFFRQMDACCISDIHVVNVIQILAGRV